LLGLRRGDPEWLALLLRTLLIRAQIEALQAVPR